MNENKSDSPNEKKRTRKRSTTAFPKNTLNEALKIVEAIRDQSGGKPFDTFSLADALGSKPSSSVFRTLVVSANKYGLIEGNYAAKKIGLSSLGQSIMYPTSDEEKSDALKQALFNVGLFKRFLERYDRNKLPRMDILMNTLLREFGIPQDNTERCAKIIVQNARDLGILTSVKGSDYVNVDATTRLANDESIPKEELVERVETEGDIQQPEEEKSVPIEPEEKVWQPRVFIAHSKNQKVLEQIKSILEFGQFKYVVAEKVPTTSAVTIPDKIFGLMHECNCAIIDVSADKQEEQPDGSYKINENVLIEIGGAFYGYDRRVIVLVDKRIPKLPTNLQGIAVFKYEGVNGLDANVTIDLQKALQSFRTPGEKSFLKEEE